MVPISVEHKLYNSHFESAGRDGMNIYSGDTENKTHYDDHYQCDDVSRLSASVWEISHRLVRRR